MLELVRHADCLELVNHADYLQLVSHVNFFELVGHVDSWVLLDFSLTVKAATLIFISGRGSAFSSAK